MCGLAVIENGVHVGLVFRDNYGVWVCFLSGVGFRLFEVFFSYVRGPHVL